MQSFEEPEQMRALSPLIAPIVAVATHLLQNGKEQEARDVLIDLTDIAETEPVLFRHNFQEHARLLIQVGANSGGADFDTETRQAALELVVSVVEGKPAYIRKDGALLPLLCETLMGLLLSIEETAAWHAAVEEQDLEDGAARHSSKC
jgi:Importin repeat